MEGRIVYPVTRDVVILPEEIWADWPKLKCYIRGSLSGVFETVSTDLPAYISSALKAQNMLHAYINSFDDDAQASLLCFLQALPEGLEMPVSQPCYISSNIMFDGYFRQLCYLVAKDQGVTSIGAYIRGLQGASASKECYVASNSIIQFVQQCYIS